MSVPTVTSFGAAADGGGEAVTYLVDTNVISELRKRDRCNPAVAAWFRSVEDAELWLSVLVVGEIRTGIEAIRRRDVRNAAALEAWLRRLVRDYGDRILPIDRAIAEEWGRMSAARSGSVVDTLLAATARVHGLTLVTRNVRDVAWTGVPCVDPFHAA
jgi:predicted nucleic acid-binding protein